MIFYTADLHFGHRNILKFCSRPWNSVEEMNEGLVARWNATVRPEDEVYVLGDFSMNVRDMELYTPRLNGTKVLVVGNHDKCFQLKQQQVDRYLAAGWTEVILAAMCYVVGPHAVNCSHFPYQYDHPDRPERFVGRRLPDIDIPLLHGHVHGHWLTRRTDKGTLMINVGVDVWNYCPVSEKQIQAILEKEGGISVQET